MKKILILGGTYFQIPAIRYAKSKGQLEKLLLRVARCIVTKDSKILSVRTG